MEFFLSIGLTFVLGAQKNRFNETVLLSTHNMFLIRTKKFDFYCEFFSEVMAIAIHIIDQLLK